MRYLFLLVGICAYQLATAQLIVKPLSSTDTESKTERLRVDRNTLPFWDDFSISSKSVDALKKICGNAEAINRILYHSEERDGADSPSIGKKVIWYSNQMTNFLIASLRVSSLYFESIAEYETSLKSLSLILFISNVGAIVIDPHTHHAVEEFSKKVMKQYPSTTPAITKVGAQLSDISRKGLCTISKLCIYLLTNTKLY